MEKEGLRLEVVPKILPDRSGLPNSAVFTPPIDQDMSLIATFKNVSMKDAPEASIEYVALVHRWGGESAKYASYRGTERLPLRFGQQAEVDIGNITLGVTFTPPRTGIKPLVR